MPRYGLEGTLRAQPGREAELLAFLLQAADLLRSVEGCELYVVGASSEDSDIIRVSEVWKDQAAHDKSLALPSVRALIATAGPLLSGRPSGTTWTPQGGKGLRD